MHKTEKPRLAFIGDSITEGWGLSDWEKERYTTLLAQAFPQYEILNFGSSGATLQSQFDMAYTNTLAFEKSIQEQPYDMLFVFLGTNDVWYWTSENTFRAEYEQLLARYTASRIFLIAPLKMNAGHYETHKLEQIRAIIKDIAQAERSGIHRSVRSIPDRLAFFRQRASRRLRTERNCPPHRSGSSFKRHRASLISCSISLRRWNGVIK